MAFLQSEKLVIKHFKAWKAAGKLGSKSSTTRASYLQKQGQSSRNSGDAARNTFNTSEKKIT